MPGCSGTSSRRCTIPTASSRDSPFNPEAEPPEEFPMGPRRRHKRMAQRMWTEASAETNRRAFRVFKTHASHSSREQYQESQGPKSARPLMEANPRESQNVWFERRRQFATGAISSMRRSPASTTTASMPWKLAPQCVIPKDSSPPNPGEES
jgi:hypothetical protein